MQNADIGVLGVSGWFCNRSSPDRHLQLRNQSVNLAQRFGNRCSQHLATHLLALEPFYLAYPESRRNDPTILAIRDWVMAVPGGLCTV